MKIRSETPSKSTVLNIRRSLRHLNQNYGVFDDKTWEGFGITYSLSQVLFVIDETPSPIAKRLSEALQLEKSTLSRFLAKLATQRLIKTDPHKKDARARVIALTEKGRLLLTQLNHYGNEKTLGALAGLSAAEVKQIESALATLARNLNGKRCL